MRRCGTLRHIRWSPAATRALLFGLVSIAAGALRTEAAERPDARQYVLECRKANGAFGPLDQEHTDAAWNHPAVAVLRLLGVEIDRPAAILAHGLGSPRGHVGPGHLRFFHEHRLRELLGAPIEPARRRVQVVFQGDEVRYYASPFGTLPDDFFQAGGRPSPDPRDVQAESFGYDSLSALHHLLEGLAASGRAALEPAPLVEFVKARRTPGGGFVDRRGAQDPPHDRDAHVSTTRMALAALDRLGAPLSGAEAERCAAFVRKCRQPDGSYRRNPAEDLPNLAGDVHHVWSALHALRLLGAKPEEPAATVRWIRSLQNADGGFGDRPGWRSRLESTFLAVESLALLGVDVRAEPLRSASPIPFPAPRDFAGMRVFQALLKMPVVAPEHLDRLLERRIHVLGLKTDDPTAALALQKAIAARRLPMSVFLSHEAYPHRVRVSGGGLLHHVGNFVLRPEDVAGTPEWWRAIDQAGRAGRSWTEYRDDVLRPTVRSGGFAYPEQDFTREHADVAYDASPAGRDGYGAVLVGFNWAPRDFVRVFPWREKFVDRLIPVADVDAHGDLAKWSPQLDHVRMLFLAEAPTTEGFLGAVHAHRAAVGIAEADGVASGISLYGPVDVVAHLRRHADSWRWTPTR